MSPKRTTVAKMSSLLSQPHFRRENTADEPASSQAVTPTPMLVDVDKIVPYDRNPRRTANATFEQIKESIRATGLDQVLVITQRPDPDDRDVYMIGAGGNTRLTALQELWRETGDTRFQQVWCQYRPWENDTRTLLAHIRENDLRSDLTFIDRALAIQDLRQLLESETGERLSQRELRDQLKAQGYQIGRTMIGWYDYTVDTLYPLIPAVLQAGLGRPQIQRLYELQRAFGRAWAAMALGDTADATPLFEQTLERYDSGILNFEALRRDLEGELSISADCDVQDASMALGAALKGPAESADSEAQATGVDRITNDTTGDTAAPGDLISGPANAPETPASGQDNDTNGKQAVRAGATQKQSDQSPPSSPTTDRSGNAGDSRQSPKTVSDQKTLPGGSDKGLDRSSSNTQFPSSDESSTPSETRSPGLPNDVKSLRSRCWTLASRLAQSARLGDIVTPIAGGIGFLVGPIPMDIQSAMHPDLTRSAICVWWQLASVSEQFARHGRACEFMPDPWQERRIGDAMRHARDSTQPFAHWQWSEADRALFTDVPPLEPNDMGPALYQTWTDARWADWVALVDTYRGLYQATDNNPWGNP